MQCIGGGNRTPRGRGGNALRHDVAKDDRQHLTSDSCVPGVSSSPARPACETWLTRTCTSSPMTLLFSILAHRPMEDPQPMILSAILAKLRTCRRACHLDCVDDTTFMLKWSQNCAKARAQQTDQATRLRLAYRLMLPRLMARAVALRLASGLQRRLIKSPPPPPPFLSLQPNARVLLGSQR